MRLQQELAARDAEVAKQIAAKQWDAARRAQTDRVLLQPSAAALEKLGAAMVNNAYGCYLLSLLREPLVR